MPERRSLVSSAALPAAVALGIATAAAAARSDSPESAPEPRLLPAIRALPLRMDTLLLGGYARGSFAEALQLIASDLSPAERTLIGRHLDRMFARTLGGEDLAQGGRLRLAYERSARPDGSTRSLRVLAAEAAVGGRLYTAFFHEHQEQPGYFDPQGQPLEPRAWARPLPELRVTSPYGTQRLHPVLERVLPHPGTDYAAAPGTPVRAAAEGAVAAAGWRGGYGNLIEIQHPNGYATRYAHLAGFAARIQPGALVRQGEVIGYVGMTGLATGPHLHYEVRRHGRPVDAERVDAQGGSSLHLRDDASWRDQQRQLSRLLERAPRLGPARRREQERRRSPLLPRTPLLAGGGAKH